MEHTTAPNLEEIVRKWAWILRLQDWEISAQFVRAASLKQRQIGEVEYDVYHRVALIRVMDVLDREVLAESEDLPIGNTVEETVIHEMLHLHLHSYFAHSADPASDEALEQAINAITGSYRRMLEVEFDVAYEMQKPTTPGNGSEWVNTQGKFYCATNQ